MGSPVFTIISPCLPASQPGWVDTLRSVEWKLDITEDWFQGWAHPQLLLWTILYNRKAKGEEMDCRAYDGGALWPCHQLSCVSIWLSRAVKLLNWMVSHFCSSLPFIEPPGNCRRTNLPHDRFKKVGWKSKSSRHRCSPPAQ